MIVVQSERLSTRVLCAALLSLVLACTTVPAIEDRILSEVRASITSSQRNGTSKQCISSSVLTDEVRRKVLDPVARLYWYSLSRIEPESVMEIDLSHSGSYVAIRVVLDQGRCARFEVFEKMP